MNEECCAKCAYIHRLKHNFKRGEGFEESYACDVWLHVKSGKDSWVYEVTLKDHCELYKGH